MIDGVLYVTGPLNHAWAIDARTGRQIWHYQRQLPAGLKVCCGMVNRGFAVYGDRLFMVTLDAHFVALEMKTGKVIYDVEMAAAKDGFAATGAPLVVNGQGDRRRRRRRVRESRIPRRLQPGDRRARSGASTRFRRPASRAAIRGKARSGSAAAARRG